jgi:small subunit ribosomal protein S17e
LLLYQEAAGAGIAYDNLYIIVLSFAGRMGRIKTDMVKRTTTKLVTAYADKFSKNFDRNKLALKETAEVRSKKLRNILAGYAVRLKKREGQAAPRPQRKPVMPGRRPNPEDL